MTLKSLFFSSNKTTLPASTPPVSNLKPLMLKPNPDNRDKNLQIRLNPNFSYRLQIFAHRHLTLQLPTDSNLIKLKQMAPPKCIIA